MDTPPCYSGHSDFYEHHRSVHAGTRSSNQSLAPQGSLELRLHNLPVPTYDVPTHNTRKILRKVRDPLPLRSHNLGSFCP